MNRLIVVLLLLLSPSIAKAGAYCWSFPGTQLAGVTINSPVIPSTNFSVCVWVYPTTSGVAYNNFILDSMSVVSANYYNGIGLVQTTGSGPLWNIRNNGSVGDISGYKIGGVQHIIPLNQWSFMCLTMDSTAMESIAYFDGTNTSSGSIYTVTVSGFDMVFGSLNYQGTPLNFTGMIDEPLVFDRVLSPTEISTLYNSGAGLYGNVSNAPWNSSLEFGTHADEDTGASSADYSGNGFTCLNVPGWAPSTVCVAATPTNTPTSTPTYTPTPTPTATALPKPNMMMLLNVAGSMQYLVAPTQTPQPSQIQSYGALGDSYSVGSEATPTTDGFSYLVTSQLATWYPGTNQQNLAVGGIPSQRYVTDWPIYYLPGVQTMASMGYTITRASIELGINNLNGSVTCDSCCYGGCTDSQGVSYSYIYQSEIQTVINDVIAVNPTCKIALVNIPDPTNGGLGPYTGDWVDSTIQTAFNQRLIELASSNSVSVDIKVANIYDPMFGQTSYYNGDIHPNNLGHTIIAGVIAKLWANNG